ncbi:stalk domain-containing protein [Bacillus sp. B190/17]|uniref:Stalk domain-containing protein n=1 Tax=Bacillus lumedeiriae TaxID=3058829 RepID=A0ABW8I7T8_9BACI
MKLFTKETVKGMIIGSVLTAGLGSGAAYAGTVIHQYKTPRGNTAAVEEENVHKNRIGVTVNGQAVNSDTWYHDSGKTFVQLRDVAEMLGAKVNYNSKTMSAELVLQQSQTTPINLIDYMPPQMSVKYFKGTGMEYAEYKETVLSLKNGLLETYDDNEGTRILSILDISQNEIAEVYHEDEVYENGTVNLATLDRYKHRTTLLKNPIEVGREINGQKIIKTNAEIKVPYGTIKNVIVLEEREVYDDGSVRVFRKYWAKRLGLVKSESIHTSGGSKHVITSELERIEPYKN